MDQLGAGIHGLAGIAVHLLDEGFDAGCHATCIVLNGNNDAQGVLVAQNPTSSAKTISGRVVFESQRGGDAWCDTSNFAAGATAGRCAPTVHIPACQTTTSAKGTLNIAGYGLVYTVVKDGISTLCQRRRAEWDSRAHRG
ncbi:MULTISPECIES: hypothetical protein [unclassified Streptomyces]|uniref:hypothetical protein n=1 Tax=unclassified Streptomyces TaxID=2593676 RepID=UPI000A58237A|nr:hypothetical protein [Streptomyces sp. TSRI0281]